MVRPDYHYAQFMPLLLSECACKQACTSSKLSCEKLGTVFKGSRVAKRRPTPRTWPPQMVALPEAPPGRKNSQLQHNTCDIQWNWPNGQLPSGSAPIISALFTTLHSQLCYWDWDARCNVLRKFILQKQAHTIYVCLHKATKMCNIMYVYNYYPRALSRQLPSATTSHIAWNLGRSATFKEGPVQPYLFMINVLASVESCSMYA